MRLHPLTAPIRAFARGIQVGSTVFFLVAILSMMSEAVTVGLLFVLVPIGLLIGAGYALAEYVMYEYELSADTFDITAGVVSRRHREIPIRRIQTVDVTQRPLQRLLGLAVVRLETAGGGQTEAELDFVSLDEARRLQATIRQRASDRAITEPTEDEPKSRGTRLFELTSRELGILGLVSLRLRVLPVIVFSIPFADQFLVRQGVDYLTSPAGRSVLKQFPSAGIVLAGVLGTIGAVVIAWVISAGLTIIRYYGFELTRVDDDLQYERGLLRRFSGSIPLDKIQVLTVTENPLMRRWGYAALTVETAGYASQQARSRGSQSAVPLADRTQVLALARTIDPFDEFDFSRPPKRARRRYAGRYLIIVGVLTVVLFAAHRMIPIGVLEGWYTPLGFVPLVPVAAHYKWVHRGYQLTDTHLVTREGFWRRTTRIVPHYRIQTVIRHRSPFQRRWGLASVTDDTASSFSLLHRGPTVLDINERTAAELQRRLRDRLQAQLSARRRDRPVTESRRGT